MPRENFEGFAEDILRAFTGKNADRPVTYRFLAQAIEAVCSGMARAIQRRDETIKALEARLTEVEAGGIKYMGVWQRAADYKRGALVTYNGALWACIRDTRDTPAESKNWQLAVKAGRDGKDAA